MNRDKFRIRFRKSGDLRLVSHHDLMRCFERMLRRAELPFRSTEGFNPRPKMAFALSLALGIEGSEEVVELELNESADAEEVRVRLSQQAPAGLEILSARRIDTRAGAQVERVRYRVALPPERVPGLHEKTKTLLEEEHCWIDRVRPQPRRIDIRPYLLDLNILPGALEIDIRVTPLGTARPDEVLGLLGLGDLLDAGAILHRTKLELSDECPALELPRA